MSAKCCYGDVARHHRQQGLCLLNPSNPFNWRNYQPATSALRPLPWCPIPPIQSWKPLTLPPYSPPSPPLSTHAEHVPRLVLREVQPAALVPCLRALAHVLRQRAPVHILHDLQSDRARVARAMNNARPSISTASATPDGCRIPLGYEVRAGISGSTSLRP